MRMKTKSQAQFFGFVVVASRMKEYLFNSFGFSLAAVFFTLSCRAADAALPLPYFPEPVMVQLQTRNFNIEMIDRIYDLGFRGFRRGLYWDQIDKGDGTYDFSKWDKEFAHAHKKGMRIIGCLFGNNANYENDPGVGGIQTEAGRKGFAKFAAAAAEHYKDYDIIWEVWTEPNVRTFWRKNTEAVGDVPPAKHNSEAFAEEYTSLVKEIAKEMLAKDPDAFIAVGSVSNFWKPSYEWTEMCFKKGILDCGVKGWSVHPYGVKLPEDSVEGYEITRDLLKRYGRPNLAVLNTERGFSVAKHAGGGEVANEGWSGVSKELALQVQAWHYVRQFMVDQMQGVAATSWYEIDGDKFGLIPDRPAATAAKVMANQLSGFKYVKRLPSDNPNDYVLLWESTGGDKKLVVWTAPPPKSAPDQAQNRSITIDGLSGNISIIDLAGKASMVSGSPAVIEVTAAPLYVAVPGGAKLGEASVMTEKIR